MAMTPSQLSYALKTLWPQSRVENLSFQDHPAYALVPKSKNFVGENLVIGLQYADTTGRSARFARAQANIGYHKGVKFTLTRVKDYQLISLETETILASDSDQGSLVAALDKEMKSGLNRLAASTGHAIFGTGDGVKASVASVATNTVTLSQADDIKHFEVGQVLRASATRTGAARTGAITRMTVTAVDRDLGTFTCSGGVVTGLAAADFIIDDGDEADGGSMQKLLGFRAWIPDTAPTSTLFCGVDRSVDTVRLGGLRIDVSAQTPEEGLVFISNRIAREGGKTSHIITNYVDLRNIEVALGAKVEHETLTAAGVGFTAVKVVGPKGTPIKLLADPDAPVGRAFALQMDTWKLASLGEMPRKLQMDGSFLSREATADAWEARYGQFCNMYCDAPGWNANCVLPA